MATTRATAAKKTTAAKTTASKKTTAAPKANSASEALNQGFAHLGSELHEAKEWATETGKVLFDSRKKDLEALRDAGKKSYESLSSLMKRNLELMNETMKEWKDLSKSTDISDAHKKFQSLNELSRKTMGQSLKSMRELGEQAISAQTEAFDVIKKRINEDVALLSKQLKVKK